MRVQNITDEQVSYLMIEVNKDPYFDTIDVIFKVQDLSSEDYESFIIDLVKVFKEHKIKIVRE